MLPETLDYLADTPRKKLNRLMVSFDNFGDIADQQEQFSSEEELMSCVLRVVEAAASLAKLELIVRHGSRHLVSLMNQFRRTINQRNWDLDFQFYGKL